MKKLLIGLILTGFVIFGHSASSRRHEHKDRRLQEEFDAIYYELGIVSRRTKIWWKNPNSWNIANNKRDVAIASNWTTHDATSVTSVNARYIYLFAIYQNSSAGQQLYLRENGKSNDFDSRIDNHVANLWASSTFWQKMDSDQKFQYQTSVDNEIVYMRCIAYME